MTNVVLEYPEDVELVFRHGRLSSFQILDAGWIKMEAAGWPSKGSQAIPMNVTIDATGDPLTVTVWATKN